MTKRETVLLEAALDTGINKDLPDLAGRCLGGYDFVDDDDDPTPPDADSHGTRMASIALGAGVGDPLPLKGVAFKASYYDIRVATGASSGRMSDAMSGMEWATMDEHKADVLSMSNGTRASWTTPETWAFWEPKLRAVIDKAYEKGIVLVAGAGNDAMLTPIYPAGYDNVIGVGAYRPDQTIRSDSNGGADIVAPGHGIFSIDNANQIQHSSGTSAATPHVAGIAALMIQYARKNNIEVNNGYIMEAIYHSAVDMPDIESLYKGNGKAWAAFTDDTHFPDPEDGSIGYKYWEERLFLPLPIEQEIVTTGYGDEIVTGYGSITPSQEVERLMSIPLYDPRQSIPEGADFDPVENAWYEQFVPGAVDLLAGGWPISYEMEFLPSFMNDDVPPSMVFPQDVHAANITDGFGNRKRDFASLELTFKQRYLDIEDELPGEPEYKANDGEATELLEPGMYAELYGEYTIPNEGVLGNIKKTELSFGIKFGTETKETEEGETIIMAPGQFQGRLMTYTYRGDDYLWQTFADR